MIKIKINTRKRCVEIENNKFKYVINCAVCGKEFGSNVKTAKYCSYDCRYIVNKSRTHKCTCVVCGKDFEGASATNKTCSEKCKSQMYTHICKYCGKEYKSGSHQGKIYCSYECKKEQLSRKCEHCNKEFIAEPLKQKYCSWICEDRATGKYEKICNICGEEFKTNYSNSKYCSEECKPILKRLCICCGKIFETKSYMHTCCSKECSSDNKDYLYKLVTKRDKVILLASKKELEEHLYDYDKFDNTHRKFIEQKLYAIYRVKVKGASDLAMKKIYLTGKHKPYLNYHAGERHRKISELEIENWELVYIKEK